MLDELHATVEAIRERLEDYRSDEREIENQTERLERLKNKMYEVGAQNLSGMPHAPSPSNDRVSDFVYRKEELEKEIGDLIIGHRETREHIERILKKIKKPDERAVIRSRFIDVQEWGDVNEMLFGGNDDFLDKEESYKRRTMYIFNSALTSMAKYVIDSGDDFCKAS